MKFMKKVMTNLKYIRLMDLIKILIFFVAFPCSIVVKLYNKLFNKRIWLIIESETTARDNGLYLFLYMMNNNLDNGLYYVIDKKCDDYSKLKKYNNVIQFGSLKHWIYYLAADRQISSQKNSNPLPFFFYVLHVYLNLFNHRVFLQHGITKDDSEWLYYKNTKFKMFICGAKEEYEFIKEKFGYPEDNLKYTGFARFDNLNNTKYDNKKILIMPTWRNWLGRETNGLNKVEIFKNSTYYKSWMKVINDKKLSDYLVNNDIIAYFYPHAGMLKYADSFKSLKNIEIVKNTNLDIQKVLIESALMITDYSSVYMDFAYMKKPIIYYQFDIDEYRKKQYSEGYFNYEDDGFGPVVKSCSRLVDEIIKSIDNNYILEPKYLKRMTDFFELKDDQNCKRIYDVIKGMK